MRPHRYALIGGILGAIVVYAGWRVVAARALAVEHVAQDTVQQCLRAEDPIFGKAIAASRQQVLAMMKEQRIPGMSITVSVDERVVWSEGFGNADLDAHRPACPETTEDLVRFGNALLRNSKTPLLREQTRDMLSSTTMRDKDLRRVYMHSGASSGTTAWMGIYPDQRVVVAVLATLGHAGFTYASTFGVGSRFARRPILPILLVVTVTFIAFFGATWLGAWTFQRLKRERGD